MKMKTRTQKFTITLIIIGTAPLESLDVEIRSWTQPSIFTTKNGLRIGRSIL